jgi:hypothetical protein
MHPDLHSADFALLAFMPPVKHLFRAKNVLKEDSLTQLALPYVNRVLLEELIPALPVLLAVTAQLVPFQLIPSSLCVRPVHQVVTPTHPDLLRVFSVPLALFL